MHIYIYIVFVNVLFVIGILIIVPSGICTIIIPGIRIFKKSNEISTLS